MKELSKLELFYLSFVHQSHETVHCRSSAVYYFSFTADKFTKSYNSSVPSTFGVFEEQKAKTMRKQTRYTVHVVSVTSCLSNIVSYLGFWNFENYLDLLSVSVDNLCLLENSWHF